MTREEYTKEELKFILNTVQLIYKRNIDRERAVYILKQVIKGVEGQIVKEELKKALKKEYPELFENEEDLNENKIDIIINKIMSGMD
jgi:membrane-bound lytic murein transglycosylase MltF